MQACVPYSSLSDDLKPLFKLASPDEAYIVVTDQTVFYAQGGGQPADTGTITTESGDAVFTVSGVRRASSGPILHLGTFAAPDAVFKDGATVLQSVDGPTRTLHSRIHDGGHIVSLSIRRLVASIPDVTELKAQHYPGAAFVEFKGHIGGDQKEAIEKAANDMVAENLPITVCWWGRDEVADRCWSVPANLLDTIVPEGEKARAVDIEGAGAYPCGGTHMRTTGEVGSIVIRKITRQKGISKVSYALKEP